MISSTLDPILNETVVEILIAGESISVGDVVMLDFQTLSDKIESTAGIDSLDKAISVAKSIKKIIQSDGYAAGGPMVGIALESKQAGQLIKVATSGLIPQVKIITSNVVAGTHLVPALGVAGMQTYAAGSTGTSSPAVGYAISSQSTDGGYAAMILYPRTRKHKRS